MHRKATLAIALHPLTLGILPAQAQEAHEVVAPEAEETIVVAGKRVKKSPLDDATPQQQIPPETLSLYGANSIGELLTRLKQQEGDPPPDIVINGRRLGSIADLAQLPPEAIASIDMYDRSEGRKFGFDGKGRVFNVVLQKQFRSLSSEIRAKTNTDGGRQGGSASIRAARLSGDRRLNGSITVNADGQLRAAELPLFADGNGGPDASETGRPGATDRGILARTRVVSGTLGTSLPLGKSSLTLSANAVQNMSSALLAANPDAPASAGAQPHRRRNRSASQNLSASWSGSTGPWFLNIMGSLANSDNNARILARGEACSAEAGHCRLQDISSRSTAGTFNANASGPLTTLPAGPLRADLSANYSLSHSSNDNRLTSTKTTSNYNTLNSRANLTVPLVNGETPILGWLGQLELTPALDFTRVGSTGHTLGKTFGVNWNPLPELRLQATLQRTPSLPTDSQLNAATLITPGVNIYDYRAGGLVSVNQLSGGAPLERSESRSFTLTGSYSRRVSSVNANLFVNYSNQSTLRPPISLSEPSPLLEAQFPERFVRDAQGTLTLVDTRAFNADHSRSRTISANISLFGIPKMPAAPAEAPAARKPLMWNLDAGVTYAMEQSLTLKPGMTAIDLLTRPLSVSGSPPSRWNLRTMASLGMRGFGGNIAYNWSSAAGSTSQSGAGSSRRASMGTMNLALFHDFSRVAPAAGAGGSGSNALKASRAATPIRLQLTVSNLFNIRPKVWVRDAAGENRLNPWLLDPNGRTIQLSLRMPL